MTEAATRERIVRTAFRALTALDRLDAELAAVRTTHISLREHLHALAAELGVTGNREGQHSDPPIDRAP